jgi:hypothetical protein
MNLKPELLETFTALGVTEDELATLSNRMMSSISSLQAQLTALSTQIETLTAQRNEVITEMSRVNITIQKLVSA